MGLHYVSEWALRDGRIDAAKPEILVYAPTSGGGRQLVAAEYFKPDADQVLSTDDDRPTLFGRTFDGPMAGHAPGMPCTTTCTSGCGSEVPAACSRSGIRTFAAESSARGSGHEGRSRGRPSSRTSVVRSNARALPAANPGLLSG
jgi:hypothetical protein